MEKTIVYLSDGLYLPIVSVDFTYLCISSNTCFLFLPVVVDNIY